jgi:CheY-like chemotaxis protein
MATILVVDDAAEHRRPVAKLLRDRGFNVVTAINAYEAMAAYNRENPDLILLDVGITPMDGLTFLMLLRQGPAGREIPVIVITGQNDENTLNRARDLEVRELLIKSEFEPDLLMTLVEKHVRRPDVAGGAG